MAKERRNSPALTIRVVDHAYTDARNQELRDFFAGQAMQALLSAPYMVREDDKTPDIKVVAAFAYEVADAMLEERDR